MTNQCVKIAGKHAGTDLLSFTAEHLRLSRRKAKTVLDSRNVFVNGRRVWMTHHALHAGDEVTLPRPASADTAPSTIPILFEDAHYVVAHKPPGLLSNETPSVESLLRIRLRQPALRAAHRLDRDTSGCLLLARSQAAMEKIVDLFRQHRVKKIYHAIVAGNLAGVERTISSPVNGEHAVTRIRTLDSSRLASHLTVRIDTGRTHQIRKHLASLGHPVLGDTSYGVGIALPREFTGIARQMLHAAAIEFVHPFTGAPLRIRCPLPSDFRSALRLLRLT